MSSFTPGSGPDDFAAAQIVYVAIVDPAPESIPRPRRIEAIFADEDAAREWQRCGPPVTMNSPLRTVEKHEVVR